MRRVLKILVNVVLLVAIIYGGITLNNYLKKNYLFPYATATDDKAILNVTWKMSPKEIERANNTALSKSPEIPYYTFGPLIMDMNRYEFLVQEQVNLWGYESLIWYKFFDKMLYEYHVKFTVSEYYKDETIEEILSVLTEEFGPVQKELAKDSITEDTINKSKWDISAFLLPNHFSYEWLTETEEVSFSGSGDNKHGYNFHISAKYLPICNDILDISRKEKDDYF